MARDRLPRDGARLNGRRLVFYLLTLSTTLAALALLAGVFQADDGLTPLECLLLALYGLLFIWVSAFFWTAVIGFLICLRGRDPQSINASLPPEPSVRRHTARDFKTAVVMPICNEQPERIFAAVQAMYRSLLETGIAEQFEFFLLSDTSCPDLWIQEEVLWHATCRKLAAEGRIHYRNRPRAAGRKSGNIADFCVRWGGRYRYMIVLDADSLMAGSTMARLVALMERNPDAGLIQTVPMPVGNESLFSRILQFASNMNGRMYAAGFHFWQRSEANYWGHNAIIRVKAFTDCCGLPELPGREPLGGEILSHDFVEAALLRRAGWKVWLAYDVEDSYEEIPPTLGDYARRDRRWCQGNLQHARLILARGFNSFTRLHFLMGVMSYLASPLWLLFLILAGWQAFFQSRQRTVYFFGENITPSWPVSYQVEMTTVLLVTLALLFLPKLLGIVLMARDPERCRHYGGIAKVNASVLLETLFSTLLAPVLMLFQTRFVAEILLRRDVGWRPQRRGDHRTSVGEALHLHGWQMLIAITLGSIALWLVPNFFWWSSPVFLGLTLVIPLSILSSSAALGRLAKRRGLFLIPCETQPSQILRLFAESLGATEAVLRNRFTADSSCLEAIVNPYVNALHLSLLPQTPISPRRRAYLGALTKRLLDNGLHSLGPAEQRSLLMDRETLQRLHLELWSRPEFGGVVS
jgi:membrane glycosyltransferase